MTWARWPVFAARAAGVTRRSRKAITDATVRQWMSLTPAMTSYIRRSLLRCKRFQAGFRLDARGRGRILPSQGVTIGGNNKPRPG